MDGIHIVAFAEEADPGEGGILDWPAGRQGVAGVTVGAYNIGFIQETFPEVQPWARPVELWEARK
jgi:hypothetical protein